MTVIKPQNPTQSLIEEEADPEKLPVPGRTARGSQAVLRRLLRPLPPDALALLSPPFTPAGVLQLPQRFALHQTWDHATGSATQKKERPCLGSILFQQSGTAKKTDYRDGSCKMVVYRSDLTRGCVLFGHAMFSNISKVYCHDVKSQISHKNSDF